MRGTGTGLKALAAELAAGRMSASELLARSIAAHDPALNVYKLWAPDFARRQAEAADAAFAAGIVAGPLQGIPVSIKDLYGVAGLPIFAGSPRALPEAWQREGPVVAGLRRQLPVVVGKTHTVEFAFGGLGANSHWPVPWNPRDRKVHRAPGGSSSGAGVSLVEGTALLAFGTDTAGSVRIPASVTGTVALKTTWGRWSTDGIVPLSPSLDTAGILTRSVVDAAFAFQALDGAAVPALDSLLGCRVGVARSFFFDDLSPGIGEAMEAALRVLDQAGARVSDFAMLGMAELHAIYAHGGIVAPELYRFLKRELPEWLETLDPRVKRRIDAGKTLEAWEYLERKTAYAVQGKATVEALRSVDVLVTPTVPITAPLMTEVNDDSRYSALNMQILRNTSMVSFLGLCALTLPIGTDAAGMPVGLQLIAPPFGEPRLLAIAEAFERAFAKAGLWSQE
ncbi:MAG TPA: amidase [Candidatus Binatia bacterium]|nr:amidase [Candidatus Binatia bacterium]